MIDADAYRFMVELCTFINTQDYLEKISIEQLRGASRREELGITSLGVIMLVAEYMEARGVSQAGFNPDWVGKLDSVEGIVSVIREIHREQAAAHPG